MSTREAPHCCDKPMVPIAYGMPGPDMLRAADRGEIELGGCVISDDRPMFVCRRCGRMAGRLDDVRGDHLDDDTWT